MESARDATAMLSALRTTPVTLRRECVAVSLSIKGTGATGVNFCTTELMMASVSRVPVRGLTGRYLRTIAS